jgi:hypothetical protein
MRPTNLPNLDECGESDAQHAPNAVPIFQDYLAYLVSLYLDSVSSMQIADLTLARNTA